MKNLMKKIRKANKGFTLVELIIVVAIIAVLAAVAAPQYIKYVEKSRQGTDANAINEIAHAAEIAMVGDGTTVPTNDSIQVAIDGTSGALTYTDVGTNTVSLADAVQEIVPATSYTAKSNLYKNDTPITITIKVTNGSADWSSGTIGSDPAAVPSKVSPTN